LKFWAAVHQVPAVLLPAPVRYRQAEEEAVAGMRESVLPVDFLGPLSLLALVARLSERRTVIPVGLPRLAALS